VIVASGDPNSVAIANYYQTKRSIPASNIITVNLTTGTDTISDTDFATLKAAIDAQLPSGVQPFRDSPSFTISGGQYVISTRALRSNSSYTLAYRTAASSTWTTLASFTTTQRAQPKVLYAPLPPANATQIHWVGPCSANSSQQCILSTSN